MTSKKFWLRIDPKEDNSRSVNATFVWTIDNILDRKEENGQSILSPSFKINKPGFKDTKWQIKLYPKGHIPSVKKVSVFLLGNTGNKDKGDAYVCCSVSLFDADSFKTSYNIDLFKEYSYDSQILNFDVDTCVGNAIARVYLESGGKCKLAGGGLTLAFTLDFDMVPVLKSPPGNGQNEGNDSQIKSSIEISENFGKLLENKDFCDMEIQCGGEVFPCHQVIISARSPVFRAMFQAKMKESESRKVIIEDITKETMIGMLYYIYTGLVKETLSKNSVVDLLVAADKYQLDALKNICRDKLFSVLDAENAIEFLILGEMYGVPKLKDAALMEVVHNMPEIADTGDYQRLKDFPSLALEIPKAMFK